MDIVVTKEFDRTAKTIRKKMEKIKDRHRICDVKLKEKRQVSFGTEKCCALKLSLRMWKDKSRNTRIYQEEMNGEEFDLKSIIQYLSPKVFNT